LHNLLARRVALGIFFLSIFFLRALAVNVARARSVFSSARTLIEAGGRRNLRHLVPLRAIIGFVARSRCPW